jgi:hypothetical protein
MKEIEYFKAYHGHNPIIYVGRKTLENMYEDTLDYCRYKLTEDLYPSFHGCKIIELEIYEYGYILG